jgi:hypothetical protein
MPKHHSALSSPRMMLVRDAFVSSFVPSTVSGLWSQRHDSQGCAPDRDTARSTHAAAALQVELFEISDTVSRSHLRCDEPANPSHANLAAPSKRMWQ